jgi:hypothetical protein
MAKRSRTGIWLVVASVAVLAFVGVLFLAEMGSEESGSDITPDMPVEEALQMTENVCMGAAGQWDAVNKAGNDDSGIPAAVRASRQCDQNATAVLEGSSSRVWANDHCKAVVEGMRDVARWQIEHGPKLFSLDVNQRGPLSNEITAQHHRGLTLMELVTYHRNMCLQQGVVG